jgi:hypothetical protein
MRTEVGSADQLQSQFAAACQQTLLHSLFAAVCQQTLLQSLFAAACQQTLLQSLFAAACQQTLLHSLFAAACQQTLLQSDKLNPHCSLTMLFTIFLPPNPVPPKRLLSSHFQYSFSLTHATRNVQTQLSLKMSDCHNIM